jgi:hypothetical protein
VLYRRSGDRSKMDFVALPGAGQRSKGSRACLSPPNGEQIRVDVMLARNLANTGRGYQTSFLAVVHRRRRSGPARTVTVVTFAHLLANQ